MADNESFLIPLRRAGFRVSWVERIPEIDVKVERDEAIARLAPYHRTAALELCESEEYYWNCEQVHGNLTIPVSGKYNPSEVIGADGLATNDPKVALGIHVADCGAIYIGDPQHQAVSVVHSGRVGTDKNILGATIEVMHETYGSRPEDLVISLAPCIRPPAYEIDFAALIAEQALAAGGRPENYFDSGICTTSNPDRYYSYRNELGKTGRMLALISL